MTLCARGLSYCCALLIAFGSVAPWVSLNGEPGGASPLGVGIALAAALVVTVATALQHRAVLGVTAIGVAALAVLALWTIPGDVLMASGKGGQATSGGGLSMILLAGLLLYVAAWLPAPRPVAMVDGAEAPADA